MNKTKKYVESIARAVFNNIVLDATSKAQKKYGFDMTKHEGAYSNTHNNEADAFKHAYMTWHLSWYYGELLRDRRRELKMTQREVAEKLGREQSYIARVERGKADIQLSSFFRIAADLCIQFIPTFATVIK